MKINFVQIAVIGLVAVLILVALGIFTGVIPGLGGGSLEKTTKTSIWIPESKYEYLEKIISFDFKKENKKIQVTVAKIPDDEYEERIINALAANNAPEVWFLPHNSLLKHRDKIALMSFLTIPERTFIDTFIDAGEIFIKKEDSSIEDDIGGIWGLPFSIDPLVLYWNKSLFSSDGIARPPETWDEFMRDAKTLTKFDSVGNIIVSGASLGEFSNIKHAKDIISLFILQTENPIIDPDTMKVTLGDSMGLPLDPTSSTIRFFNEFSNPKKPSYSWNYNMANSQDAFASYKLGMYMGYASEYPVIIEKNPHLNFDVAEIPQIRGGKIKATFSNIDALVLSKYAARSSAAFKLMTYLVSSDVQEKVQESSQIPSARRDILSKSTDSAKLAIFARSAIKTRVWLDPDPDETYEIFKNMVESVRLGQKTLSTAVKDAKNKLQNVLSQI